MNLGSPLTLDTNDQWIEGGEQATTGLLARLQQDRVADS